MKLHATFLRRTVARQLLLLFVVCALVPIGTLAVVSFEHVDRELHRQSERRLHQASKATGLAVLGRLLELESELKALAASASWPPAAPAPRIPVERLDLLADRFRSLAVSTAAGEQLPLFGPPLDPLQPSPRERTRIASEMTALATARSPEGKPRVLLRRLLRPGDPRRAILVAEVEIGHLLAISHENTLPANAEFCVLDESHRVIACSKPSWSSLPERSLREMRGSVSGQFEWSRDGEEYLASYWSIFLKPTFGAPEWTVVLSESKREILAPIARFRATFPLVVLLCFALVCLLSMSQIQRRLVPLEKLREGTRRIARRDFDVEVEVDSNDEFEELAASFNAMTRRLREQFDSLNTMIDIDRSILSTGDAESIVNTVLERMRELYRCDALAVMLREPAEDEPGQSLRAHVSSEGGVQIEVARLSSEDLEQLDEHPESLVADLGEEFPPYLEMLARAGIRRCAVLPLFARGELAGLVALGHREGQEIDAERLVYARQLADQATVALSGARAVEENQILAYHDSLTGLPNRLLVKERLKKALRDVRDSGRHVAVCLLDLDDFKRINDTLGHEAGDLLLRQVTERISTELRAGCPASGPDLGDSEKTLGRLGGDEFAVVLGELSSTDDAALVAFQVLSALSAPFYLGNHELVVAGSIGIAVFPEDGSEAESLLKNADAAMYFAKDRGGNGFHFYTKSMNSAALRRLKMEKALRGALERDEFRLFYQPVVDIETCEIIGMEALMRWQSPRRGLVPPDEFIPLAEKTGLIVPLGEWALRSACAQNRQWQTDGLPPLRVSVNLSSRQFKNESLPRSVRRALLDAKLPPQYLTLELTESMLMQADEANVRMMNELRKMDLQMSIDDFGTGYSSLSHLKHFPVDQLKIDRSFVAGVTKDPDDAAITRAVIAMAHGLDLTVVAEGVENEEQLAFLRELDCDAAQGRLFSEPLPPDAFEKLLRKWRPRSITS